MLLKLSRNLLFFFSCASLATYSVFGQDNGLPPEPAGDTTKIENQQMSIITTNDENGGTSMIVSSFSSSDGQPAILAGLVGDSMQFHGDMMRPMDPISLLHHPDVQKEIELDANQLESFQKSNSEFQKQMQAHSSALRDGTLDSQKLIELAKKVKTLRAEQDARMREILVPSQLERLQQISTQQFIHAAGTADALASNYLAEQLGLSPEQIERLKKRGEEVSKELQEKIQQLKDEAREKILGELTSEQREKINQLMGKKYNLKFPEFPGLPKRVQPSKPAANK